MNDPRQLVEEPGVTVGNSLASAPVPPARLAHQDETFITGGHFAWTSSEDADSTEAAVSAWKQSAQQYANKLSESFDHSTAQAVVYSRLSQAQLSAGMFCDAEDSANTALNLVNKAMSKNGEFDLASTFSCLRILRSLGKLEEVTNWLTRLPAHSLFIKLEAEIAVEQGCYDKALMLLQNVDDTGAFAAIRGYAYLQLGDAQRALHQLRAAARDDPRDPTTFVNMAFAYWILGAQKKAVRYARQASSTAPWRKDISFTLLELLLVTSQIESAYEEIRRIKARGYVETPELLLMSARIELARDRPNSALTTLRRALAEARKLGESEKATLIQANLAVIEAQQEPKPSEGTLRKIREAIGRTPDNISLIELFASNADRMHYAAELRRYVEPLMSRYSESQLNELNYRLAYLEGRYDDALRFADLWSASERLNPQAATAALLLRSQLVLDAHLYTSEAINCARRFGRSRVALNNVAYALALCGQAAVAHRLLTSFGAAVEDSFYLKATAGLVEVASGRLESGMRLYRQAAEMADRSPDGRAYRSLMTLHQAIALRQLGLLDRNDRKAVVAQALPAVDLPDDWEDWPHFRMLKVGVDLRGWEWPLHVE